MSFLIQINQESGAKHCLHQSCWIDPTSKPPPPAPSLTSWEKAVKTFSKASKISPLCHKTSRSRRDSVYKHLAVNLRASVAVLKSMCEHSRSSFPWNKLHPVGIQKPQDKNLFTTPVWARSDSVCTSSHTFHSYSEGAITPDEGRNSTVKTSTVSREEYFGIRGRIFSHNEKKNHLLVLHAATTSPIPCSSQTAISIQPVCIWFVLIPVREKREINVFIRKRSVAGRKLSTVWLYKVWTL